MTINPMNTFKGNCFILTMDNESIFVDGNGFFKRNGLSESYNLIDAVCWSETEIVGYTAKQYFVNFKEHDVRVYAAQDAEGYSTIGSAIIAGYNVDITNFILGTKNELELYKLLNLKSSKIGGKPNWIPPQKEEKPNWIPPQKEEKPNWTPLQKEEKPNWTPLQKEDQPDYIIDALKKLRTKIRELKNETLK